MTTEMMMRGAGQRVVPRGCSPELSRLYRLSEVEMSSERDAGQVDVVLEGGPAWPPLRDRRRRVLAGEPEVKVRHAGRVDHFCRTVKVVEVDQCECEVYRWSYRTHAAE